MPAHARNRRGGAELARTARRGWRDWRRSRPFWGALITLAAGGETAAVRFSLPVHPGWTLLPAGLLIAGGLIACGLLLLFDPAQRSLYAVLAIVAAIAALRTSHLGGYLVGTLLGLAGGATAFAWVPGSPAAPPAAPPGFTLILGEADPGPGPQRPGPARRPGRPLRSAPGSEPAEPGLAPRERDRP
jgi:hypothetical protein